MAFCYKKPWKLLIDRDITVMKRLLIGALAMASVMVLDGCKKDEGANDALSVIAARTSVRRYDASREVTDEMVEKMLRAATAVNLQPWEFVVV